MRILFTYLQVMATVGVRQDDLHSAFVTDPPVSRVATADSLFVTAAENVYG